MTNNKRDHDQRPQGGAKTLISIGAMAYALQVAATFEKLETGYRNGLYNWIGMALISYRKFLKDPSGYRELLGKPNILMLPEKDKPRVEETSRLVLYFLTGAKRDAERNTAGKFARIVDYLHEERVENAAAAAERIRKAGGIEKILKEARKGEALKAADDAQQEDDRDIDQEEEPDDADDSTSTSDEIEDLFDPEVDIAARVGAETLERVLSSEIPLNEEFYLVCRKTGSIGRNGILIEGDLYDPDSE
jgi:hypothetical protein